MGELYRMGGYGGVINCARFLTSSGRGRTYGGLAASNLNRTPPAPMIQLEMYRPSRIKRFDFPPGRIVAGKYQIDRPLKLLQRVFITAVILPLFLLGLLMLIIRREFRTLAILSVVPVYYLCVQSLIYTEYRFILAVPHFFLIFGAIGVCGIVGLVSKRRSVPEPGRPVDDGGVE